MKRYQSNDLVEIAGELVGDPTEKAYRIFDGKVTEWVPKSQVEQVSDNLFEMPYWLAKSKGFL